MSNEEHFLSCESRGLASSYRRLDGRRIAIFGGGQDNSAIENPPVGNGRAILLLLTREGATAVAADKSLFSAEETSEKKK